MSELVPLPAPDLARAATYARQALAPATLAAYAADWSDFGTRCRGRGVAALPAAPATVAAYLAVLASSHARVALRRRVAPLVGSPPAVASARQRHRVILSRATTRGRNPPPACPVACAVTADAGRGQGMHHTWKT